MTDLINGRTPSDIKKALELCVHGCCGTCPYFDLPWCKDEIYRDALAYIESLEMYTVLHRIATDVLIEEKPKWISVKDRLPDDNYDWVLAVGKFIPEGYACKPIISELRKNGEWWGDISDEFPLAEMGIEVTHWMPLPEPPVSKEER